MTEEELKKIEARWAKATKNREIISPGCPKPLPKGWLLFD